MTGIAHRVASLAEIRLMLKWAADEGWNPGLDDAEPFQAADPGGFFVAVLDGEPVAAISVVNHSASISFLGLYLCRPDMRGKGIGFGLWNHALSNAGDRTIGLDGVPAQEDNYAKSGFVLAGRTCRLHGSLPASPLAYPIATAGDIGALLELDKRANGIERPAFLSAWTADGPTRKTVLLRERGRIGGFATARLCRDGCKIGPVIAPRADQALDLAIQAASALAQTRVVVDTPGPDTELAGMLKTVGFVETFSTARMYRGPAPQTGPGLHGIATMELG